MSLAHRCELCDDTPTWVIVRRGDAVTTWSCSPDLPAILTNLQRDHEVTELVVRHHPKAVEWATITRSLNTIAATPP